MGNLPGVRTAAVAQFAGPFRVSLPDGTDITPGSALRQAILAVLAAGPGQIRSRKVLQDMFWGAADPARASASLRTALYLLRRDLEPLGEDVLRADRQAVSLQAGRVVPAGIAPGTPAFLEGMDLQLQDCEGFEDWLRTMRQPPDQPSDQLADQAAQSAPVASPGAAALWTPSHPALHRTAARMALGLLPSIQPGLPPVDVALAEGVLDDIARCFAQVTFLDVHDLRGHDHPVHPLPLASGLGPTHWLQAQVERREGPARLRLRLAEAQSRRLVWLSEPMPLAAAQDGSLAAQITEAMIEAMRADAGQDAPNLFPFTALAALFALDDRLLFATEAQLLRMIDAGGPPVLECLLLFAQVFKANEAFGAPVDVDVVRLCERLGSIPNPDPMLPLSLSLAGYSLHMLRAENGLAFHLIETAFRLAPNLPLNLDHLAVLRLVQGDLRGAEEAFRQCIAAGSNSPWRYTYEVTGAMIHLAQGDLPQSLHFANQSLFRKPRYLAALRYAMVGLALSDKPNDARRMLGRLNSLRPGYDLSSWAESIMRRTPPDLGAAFVRGLRENQLL